MKMMVLILMFFFLIHLSCGSQKNSSGEEVNFPQTVLELNPSDDNPRNGEGDFITLKEGRILFIYSHFCLQMYNSQLYYTS